MPEGRAWIDELWLRIDTLDERARAEVLFTMAVTAVEVGDDASALAAIDGINRVIGRVDDPALANSLQLAIAWTLPITNDFEGALVAASATLDGFRRQDEPFVAFAALTVGMLEMTFGRFERAGELLHEVDAFADRFGNSWLTSTARAQLATLAVRAGDLDEAATLLIDSLNFMEFGQLSTLTATFALVAFAELALARADPTSAAVAFGACSGLRRRAGLLAWPLTRPLEADLLGRVRQAIDDGDFSGAFERGAELHHREALTFIRDHT
jgi:hypothetical protein